MQATHHAHARAEASQLRIQTYRALRGALIQRTCGAGDGDDRHLVIERGAAAQQQQRRVVDVGHRVGLALELWVVEDAAHESHLLAFPPEPKGTIDRSACVHNRRPRVGLAVRCCERDVPRDKRRAAQAGEVGFRQRELVRQARVWRGAAADDARANVADAANTAADGAIIAGRQLMQAAPAASSSGGGSGSGWDNNGDRAKQQQHR